MEGEESLLDAINEEDEIENIEDVDMVDVEEGEIVVDHDLHSVERQNGDGDGDKDKEMLVVGKKNAQNQQNKKKKKKKRRKGPVMGKPMDLDRYLNPFLYAYVLSGPIV